METLLRLVTLGSVDDGKSTLIGRLLLDTGSIARDHLAGLKDLAWVTDGLKAEREQGITIDVAYRYFSTPERKFILADSPGHEQYTRNMVTAASTADLALVLVDVTRGLAGQTLRHARIARMLGVGCFIAAVNKMDRVGFSEEAFLKLRGELAGLERELASPPWRVIPISALEGDNVTKRSPRTPWYRGETLLEALGSVEKPEAGGALRLPIQGVIRAEHRSIGGGDATQYEGRPFRGIAGQIARGALEIGQEVVLLPSGRRARIRSLEGPGGATRAIAPASVVATLEEEIDFSRGDVLADADQPPCVSSRFEADLVWLAEEPSDPATLYRIQQACQKSRARIEGPALEMNETASVLVSTTDPLVIDPYVESRLTGSFILIDPLSNHTVAAGMVRKTRVEPAIRPTLCQTLCQTVCQTVWMTGLSGAGKSTIAEALAVLLTRAGEHFVRLDGDVLRRGLNRDLGFSSAERTENIRRTAELARLLNEQGITVVASLISPEASHRALAREIIGSERFREVFVSAPLEVCESRDPKGLYAQARRGQIRDFTGIHQPYEAPLKPDLVLDTTTLSAGECALRLRDFLAAQLDLASIQDSLTEKR